jgi:glycosyltransferase involved in cell wall biosynthesis
VSIKVLFLLSNFRAGGAERQYFNLIHGIDKSAFEVHVGLIQYRDNRPSKALLESLADVKVRLFERKHRADITVVTEIAGFARENNIDIIQSLLFMDNQIARLAGLISKKTVVTSIRGEILPLLGKHKCWLEYKMQVLSAKVVVNSHWLKEYLVQHGSRAEKVVVIHNGTAARKFRSEADRSVLLAKYGIPRGTKVIGIVARLHPMKDHRTFLDVVKLVQQKLPGVHAVVAGDGELMESLKSYVKKIGIENSVTFLGTVTEALPEIYRIMDVFLLTSQWGESFPNVVLEAMSASVPVVASNISAVPEIIEDGRNGYLVPKRNASLFADKTITVLTNGNLRKLFVANGLTTVEQFGVDPMIKKYERLYRDLANKRSQNATVSAGA